MTCFNPQRSHIALTWHAWSEVTYVEVRLCLTSFHQLTKTQQHLTPFYFSHPFPSSKCLFSPLWYFQYFLRCSLLFIHFFECSLNAVYNIVEIAWAGTVPLNVSYRSNPSVTKTDDCVNVVSPQGWQSRCPPKLLRSHYFTGFIGASLLIVMT